MSRILKLKFHTEPFDVDVADVMKKLSSHQRERIEHLERVLAKRYKSQGHNDGDAKRLAGHDIDTLISAALMDFSDVYLGPKTKAVHRLFDLQGEVFEVYDTVLRSRSKLGVDVENLRAKYTEISKLFDELKVTPEQAIPKTNKANVTAAANGIKVTPTALPAGTKFSTVSERFKTLDPKKGWMAQTDGSYRRVFEQGTVDLKDVNGLVHVTFTPKAKGSPPVQFKEFDTLELPYRLKPGSSRVVQAHHGCQDALMKQLFGNLGYDGGEAPTIWLRDSTGESPHGVITHSMQNPNLAKRSNTPDLDYGKIRDLAVADLKAAGAPDDSIRKYLLKMDEYFARDIEPKLVAKGKLHLKGEIKVY